MLKIYLINVLPKLAKMIFFAWSFNCPNAYGVNDPANRARRRLTSLIETNAPPLRQSQTTNISVIIIVQKTIQ